MHITPVAGVASIDVLDAPQVIFDEERWSWVTFSANIKQCIWKDSLAFPSYFAVASLAVLVIHLIVASGVFQKLYRRVRPAKVAEAEDEEEVEELDAQSVLPPSGLRQEFKEHVGSHGGLTIYVLKVVRLLASLGLLGLSVATLILEEKQDASKDSIEVFGKHWGKKPKNKRTPGEVLFTPLEWLQFALCMTFAYTSILGFVSVSTKPRWASVANFHMVLILLFTAGVYTYRDLYPLATFTLSPIDLHEGWLLWSKIGLVLLSGVVIPLVIPRPYVPFDPKACPDPQPTNPEQTASIFSLAVYSFLDPIVFKAYRLPHLSHTDLPPLADYDFGRNLVKRSFKHLDTFSGAKGDWLFWGLMRVFRREYLTLAGLIFVRVVGSMLSPLAINRLLAFMQNGLESAIVRPWVWILFLFLGPVISAVAIQYYVMINTGTLVRTEGIITQLVFEHALRVRMKAEAAGGEGKSTDNTAVGTPDTASIAEASPGGSEGSEDETAREPSTPDSQTKGKGKDKDAKKSEITPAAAAATHCMYILITHTTGRVGDCCTLVSPERRLRIQYLRLYSPMKYLFLDTFLHPSLQAAYLSIPTVRKSRTRIHRVENAVDNSQKYCTRNVVYQGVFDVKMWSIWTTIERGGPKLLGEDYKSDFVCSYFKAVLTSQHYRRRMNSLVITYCTRGKGTQSYRLGLFQHRRQCMGSYRPQKCIWARDFIQILGLRLVTDLRLSGSAKTCCNMHITPVAGVTSIDVLDAPQKTELLDSFSDSAPVLAALSIAPNGDDDAIGLKDVTFSWSAEEINESLTPSKRNFRLRIEDELLFKKGCVNLVIGPTGSGKTSLLMALLVGEMHFIPSGPGSWFGLPRGRGVAYAAQEAWVQNETIRENILFGAPYDEERYKKVVYQCALTRDLTLFDAGDQTEVGEKGLTLSGGQKARITLARAVYSQAEILLLDDVLAALDVHTAKWIVDKCLNGDLIRGRTVILVTHNVALASPVASFVVSIGTDGRILSQGTVSDALAKNHKLSKEVAQEEKAMEKVESEIDSAEEDAGKPDDGTKKDAGKLVVAEEVAVGHVSWSAVKLYLLGMSGNWPLLFWSSVMGCLIACELSNTVQTWFLGYWAQQYQGHTADELFVSYLTIYVPILVAAITMYCIGYAFYYIGSIRASRDLHKKLIDSILGTTLRWLDKTPTSRVIARCTQDIRAVDGPIPQNLGGVIEISLAILFKFGAVVLFTPIFIIPGFVVAALGGWLGQIYIKAQLSVKREMSNARAPVLGHFGAAIAGLTSIRAYGSQEAFKQESLVRIDRYTKCARMFYGLNCWMSMRIESLSALFTASLAAWLVYAQPGGTASNTGFSLTMAVGFSGLILWWVRILNELEVAGTLERIHQYVEQEPKPTEDGVPPAYWPSSGNLKVEKLIARYSLDGPAVLHDISFEIKAGERVGIVGRTGSGKSSLTLSLLRCIPTQGTVYYDGKPTDTVNLDALRSHITIIPQVPELLSGSLRQNLDPFDQYDDATLNDALRHAGLFSLQSTDDESRITLDSQISSGGGNLSVGQRQILALARAIVRQSKLLILDEATSAIDHETDTIIQKSLRTQLPSDVTIITVAHRLQTIMDADKIMVLDAGCIVEFGSPNELLRNEKGRLRALVDESNDKFTLYAMAQDKERSDS
ncbi:P-loop containing nucleoside triphosphate hydrolase protein [Neolentinus lepideus HHB14362 ss-1]|uniref:p-loop containing nucleoside triphosphate hydrolase protein n=1 Tax=Neolentinus lepideus HHB14362 ss-1 TaxID=1314782 RepID=A0A165VDB0_9AGAM|nr:P-loop containing nucleoside triphosphate hydrolase protein [Neolentinus lepideus HHB14362 ss-1]